MKKIRFKSIIVYTLSFLLAVALLAYLFKDMDISRMWEKLKAVEFGWIFISIGLSLLSHLARAYRWNLLLSPMGHKPPTAKTFLAVMTGYFSNLLLPRMGEVTRCGMLNRMTNIPVSTSFGTVVAERVFDFLALLTLLSIAVIVEFDKLSAVLLKVFGGLYALAAAKAFILYSLIGILIILSGLAVLLYRRHKSRLHELAIYQKVRKFGKELLAGLMSVRRLENKAGFWLSTLAIWVFYYLMSYLIVFAVPETNGLNMWAGLSILVMGGLGMSAPVQGGIGTYHAMVSSVLLLYGIAQEDGVMFATVLHTSQTLSVICFGGLSTLLTLWLSSGKRATVKA
jgi:glycosyltransferase 2 family protein